MIEVSIIRGVCGTRIKFEVGVFIKGYANVVSSSLFWGLVHGMQCSKLSMEN